MDSYIKQLIEQFKESAMKVPLPSKHSKKFKLDDEGEKEDFQYVEQFMYGTPYPLSKFLGIKKRVLPDDSKLNDTQVELLSQEMEALWKAYHFYPDFPAQLPPRLRYRKLREYWDKKQVFVGVGEIHIEFCEYDEPNCPFQGYCKSCEEISKEFDNNKNLSNIKEDNEIKGLFEPEEKKSLILVDNERFLPSDIDEKKIARTRRKEKIKKILKKRPPKSQIPFIHNYCDRWCEKCTFTKRCGSFALEKELYPNESDKDFQNKEFWENLSTSFEAISELLKEKLQEFGIEPGSGEDEIDLKEDEIENQPLFILSNKYYHEVHDWMDKHWELIEKKIGKENKLSAKDALDTIIWFHAFINVKLHRALSGFFEKEENENSDYDMNGSAKIAIIAIENSIGAWGIMLQNFNEYEDDIFAFISRLQNLLNNAKLIFPNALSFIRPGFDE